MWESWMAADAFPGTCYAVANKGWMTETVFLQWFQHQFLRSTNSIEGPKLLLYDGHLLHVFIELISCAIDNQVSILKLPPHTTHILQPLDVVAFKPLKTKWDELLVNWQRHHYGVTMKLGFGRTVETKSNHRK